MAYYSRRELSRFGFRSIGSDVLISRKASIYDHGLIDIGDRSRVDDYCILSGNLSIGSNVHITPMCLLAGGALGIVLEDFVTLAYGVKIFSQSDDYSGETLVNSTIPACLKNEKKQPVLIEKHVVVGASCTIFPGVVLGEGCAVGAMSLVLESSRPWVILAGVPARILKPRSRALLSKEIEYRNTYLS